MEWKTDNIDTRHRLLLIAIFVMTMVLFAACSGKTGATVPAVNDAVPPYAEEEVMTEPETLPPVQVEMPEYELTYSGELANLIVVTEQPQTSNLVFSVKLSDREAHIFTLNFNSAEGELVTFVTNKAGERIPVSFEMAEVPEGLSNADADSFYTAQDAVNEIVKSLVIK